MADLWFGGRNHYLAVWGEYEPCGGYTFERVLFRSETLARHGLGAWNDITITARLRVDTGGRSRFRLDATISPSTIDLDVESGACCSLADAKRRADAALRQSTVVRDLLVSMYGRGRLVCSEEGHAFLTLFCSDYFVLPDGKWAVLDDEGTTEVHRRGGCYSSSFRKKERYA